MSRKKDLIIRGGSNISPAEVESVLISHPAVRHAAVVGVADSVLGQRLVGLICLIEDVSAISADDILAEASTRLADYKVPERLVIVNDIPRNALGKIDRRLALTMFSEQAHRAAILNGELSDNGGWRVI